MGRNNTDFEVGTTEHEKLESRAAPGSDENRDHFTGSHFADDEGNHFSVQDVVAHAQSNPSYFHKNFPLNKLAHDRAYWQGDKERMNKADTSFPLLVVKDGNNLSVADGLNRMEKAITVEGKKNLDVHIVPKKDIMHLAKKKKK